MLILPPPLSTPFTSSLPYLSQSLSFQTLHSPVLLHFYPPTFLPLLSTNHPFTFYPPTLPASILPSTSNLLPPSSNKDHIHWGERRGVNLRFLLELRKCIPGQFDIYMVGLCTSGPFSLKFYVKWLYLLDWGIFNIMIMSIKVSVKAFWSILFISQ